MHHAFALLSLAAAIAPAAAETVHGAVVFSRHGDRSSKHYSGYSLTNLGFQQNFKVGSGYRARYLSANSSHRILGISENKYVSSQVYASAPDQQVLLNTATAFLQGLYPPLQDLDPVISTATLNNGTKYANPLNGYQYVVLHGEDVNSPDTIWIKGDDGCPATTKAGNAFKESAIFKSKLESTKSFYAGFWDVLKNVYDYKQEALTYAKAYDIFDLINVGLLHNATMRDAVTPEQLYQLRTLADSAEFNSNFNASEPDRSIGGRTLAGAILNQLNQTVSTKGKLKFSLLAGSYDTFLAVFGITDLIAASPNFYGLPDYASTMSFELFTKEDTTAFPTDTNALNIRFLFRNGSDISPLTEFPLFGRTDAAMPWPEFVAEMKKRSITSVKQWCNTCSSKEDFCLAYADVKPAPGSAEPTSSSGSHMSAAVAGVVGAMVTLGVFAIGGLLFFLVRRRKTSPAAGHNAEKASRSGSESA